MIRGALLVACCIANGFAAAATWTASVDERNGLPALSGGGASALTAHYAFWGGNWNWAEQQTQLKVVSPFTYTTVGANRSLGLTVNSRISRSGASLVWEFDLDAARTSADVIGGGIAFKFELETFRAQMGEPEILPGNRGWAWGRAGASRVEMRFDPPLAALEFDGGNRSELRAFFYKGEVPQGRRRHVATLTVSGDMALGPTRGERFGLDDPTRWPADILDWKTSPVDLSFLNASERPAGKRGFLKAVQDKLIFEDGTPARFWGTNLTAAALFGTSREGVRQQAKRLSALGFNLVRLHHHDSDWVNPNVFGRDPQDTQSLDPQALAALDWWVKCLKEEGIYVWLDLHVGRSFGAADRIEGFAEIAKGKPVVEAKGYSYVNPSIQQAMKRFNQAYAARYKDEPAVVAMLITNENDVTHHFGNALLPDKNVPKHSALYRARADAFAEASGLPKRQTWRAWEYGPSKLFLNDLERGFGAEMIAQLRAAGVKVPIATTSTWGDAPLSSLPALTAGSLVDAHSYGGSGELEKNPLFAPNLVHWLAAAQVVGRPLSVTEWNVESFPAPDRHTVPLYVAAVARHQGWDALMQYAYAQVPLDSPGTPSNWHAYNDPALVATLPAAALLFRRGDVAEAATVYAFAPGTELFNQAISPRSSVALRTAAERGRLIIALPAAKELPWLEASPLPAGARVLMDPKESLIDAKATHSVSDTGELRRSWEEGIYTIDTPRTQAAMGWIGGRRLALADVEIAVTTRNATVSVQSLDDAPIARAKAILVSLGARAVPRSANELPYYSEPVQGMLVIRAPKGLTLYYGNKALPAPYVDGAYRVRLDRELGTRWLTLKATHK